MKYLEDIAVGERDVFGSHTFTAEEIKAFAARFDPQPFHLDEAAAAQSHFGALCASGWHTASLWMCFMVKDRDRMRAEQRARGEPIARTGPSPGFRDLKWLKPVYAGDTVTYATEIRDKQVSKSRPGWGLIHVLNTGVNQEDELIFSFKGTEFVERRPAGGAP